MHWIKILRDCLLLSCGRVFLCVGVFGFSIHQHLLLVLWQLYHPPTCKCLSVLGLVGGEKLVYGGTFLNFSKEIKKKKIISCDVTARYVTNSY